MKIRSRLAIGLSAITVAAALSLLPVGAFVAPASAGAPYSCTSSGTFNASCGFSTPDMTDFQGPLPATSEVDNNVGSEFFSPCTGAQAIKANSDQDYKIAATFNNTTNPGEACSFPGATVHYVEGYVNAYSLISSFNETMPHGASIIADGGYDVWLNNNANEVRIETDFANGPSCAAQGYTQIATNVPFSSPPSFVNQYWNLCESTSTNTGTGQPTLVLKLTGGNESFGLVNIGAMAQYLEATVDPASSNSSTLLPPNSGYSSITQGFQIWSTGGVNKSFVGNGFTLSLVSVHGTCSSPYIFTDTTGHGTASIDGGGQYWFVNSNAWGGHAGAQTLNVCSQSSWNATTDQPNDGQDGVEQYPNSEFDFGSRSGAGDPESTTPLTGFSSIDTTYAESDPAATGTTSYDAGYDLWTVPSAEAGTTGFVDETMVWNQWAGTQSAWATALPDTAVTIGGVNYHFHCNENFGSYSAPSNTCTASNQVNEEYIFTADTENTSGSIDALQFWNWEVANGYANSTDVPAEIQYGTEIIDTNGGNETFNTTGFTVTTS